MRRFATLFLVSVFSIGLSGSALAGSICSECQATFQVFVDGEPVANGSLPVDSAGNVVLEQPIVVEGADFAISLDSLVGNVDPFLIFSGSATNNSAVLKSYAFAFSLPISLGGEISAAASVSYSVTDGAGDGATLFPTSGTGKVVDSQDIRLSPFLSTDKGVDVGDACTVGPPAGAYVCGPFNASSIFGSVGGPTYDLMSVVLAFGLTAGDAAGVSGVVTQVPEPGTLLLLGSGLVGLLTFGRRAA